MQLAINADLTITVEKLLELTEIWGDKDIGNWLELPESKVNEIKIIYDSPFRRREAYLDLYATHHPCPSWKHVAKSLRSIGLVRQAGEVESTYVQGTYITCRKRMGLGLIGVVKWPINCNDDDLYLNSCYPKLCTSAESTWR